MLRENSERIDRIEKDSRQRSHTPEVSPPSAHSRLFKKLSMSFYNWATKNNEKQVVCQSYDEPFSEAAYHSLSYGKSNQKGMKEHRKRKVKKLRPPPKTKAMEEPLCRSNNFNEYYFQGITNVPIKKKDLHEQSYQTLSRVPRQVTQFYFRRFVDEGDSKSKNKSKLRGRDFELQYLNSHCMSHNSLSTKKSLSKQSKKSAKKGVKHKKK